MLSSEPVPSIEEATTLLEAGDAAIRWGLAFMTHDHLPTSLSRRPLSKAVNSFNRWVEKHVGY